MLSKSLYSFLGQSFLIFRFTDPPTPNSLVLEKKIKLKFRPNFFFCWVELFTAHD